MNMIHSLRLGPMASLLLKPSLIRPFVILTTYVLILCYIGGVVDCVGAPAYPPVAAGSPDSAIVLTPAYSSAQSPNTAIPLSPAYPPVQSPAITPVPAPAPNSSWHDPACGLFPVKYQGYEKTAMVALLRAWNKTDPSKSMYNITNWKESVHPCDRAEQFSGWRGLRCQGKLVDHGNGTVCEMFLVGLGVEYRGIIGQLVPEIGDLINLEFIYVSHNPGLIGSIPATIWNLPNLKEVRMINNSLSGSVELNSTIKSTALERIDLSQNYLTSWSLNYSNLPLQYLNLSNNNLSGPFNLGKFNSSGGFKGSLYTKLTSLDLSNNYLNDLRGSIVSSEFDLPLLRTLYMSNNSLGGTFKNPILKSPIMQSLYFDSNRFNGTLSLPAISFENSSLNTISLTDNHITRIEYPNGTTETTLSRSHLQIASILFLGGNPLCNSGDHTEPLPVLCRHNRTSQVVQDKLGTNTRKIIIAATIPAAFLLIIIFILAYLFLKNRRKHQYLLLGVQQKFAEHELKPTLFVYNELQKATRDFHPDMKLGEGAFGAVYRGYLPDGTEVAVKQLFNTTQQNMDEFLNEVVLLTGIKHRNLVKLKGCCLRGDRRLLVYEYVENSDLADVLFHGPHKSDRDHNPILSWRTRFNICLGVAQGLHYLHALVDPKIIHRDIKASNILLDKKFEAKIADFGMALLFPSDMSQVMTVHIAGTKGYLAPEYASLGQLSEKADVWSFGVLLLEVVAGRSNIDGTLDLDKIYLAPWAWRMHEEDTLLDLVDPDLAFQNDEEVTQVQRFILVALSCLQTVAERRPTMAQVVTMLQNDMEIPSITGNYPVSNRASQQSISEITFPQSSDLLRSGESSILPMNSIGSVELSELRAR
ncbi:hypothetical protein KC19_10G174000 [Ceratodon purpureus]|uniref:Protein kinase domain-containing protein n=1 Tax=Ceratodon purpureus TaxID=3225 RepID=A0A8T0GLD8_CERPU|nr:hypothetical protein KC19_10G174000 [Ceratodon purpureus]